MRIISCRTLHIVFLLLIAATGSSPAHAGEPHALASAVLDGIGAEVVDCPVTGIPYVGQRVCAEFRPTLHAFREAWDRFVLSKPELATATEPQGDWEMGWGSCCYRDYLVGDAGFRVMLDLHAHVASLVFGSRASDPTSAQVGHEGISAPKLVSRKKPRYPKAAKKMMVTGRVALQVEVRDDGTVGQVGLVWACPQGYGMEEAAVNAVNRWRFEPAVHDGRPVEATQIVVVDFGLKATDRVKDIAVSFEPPPVMGAPVPFPW